ncbi:MAG TPA: class I SAM-dependent methyltransferase, partial [Smithella sp.]|nr:class I SAM-dependent methyltransferase [Smithella sp.]
MSDRIKKLSDENPQCAAEVFSDYAPYYDLLYRDKDYKAEAEYVANLIREFHPATRNILELGSGTGIHANLLAEMGFSVHGIERSQEMYTRSLDLVDKQNSQYGRPTFTHGDIREIRLNKSFDAVISLFHVISYQTTNE